MNGDTDLNRARSATVTVEFYDGTVRTIQLHDDPEGVRLEGALEINVEPREVNSGLPWRTYEPGASTASVRLSGPGVMRAEPMPVEVLTLRAEVARLQAGIEQLDNAQCGCLGGSAQEFL